MDETDNHNSEQNGYSASDQWPHLAPVHAPGALLPTVLARLGLANKHFPPGSSIEALLAALHDPAWQVRTAAVQALRALGEDVPIEALIAALDDEDASVRTAVMRALGGLGERAPLEPLLAALQDPEWLVREIAAMMLGTLGERVPIEPLMAAMQDENPFVRQAAALALTQRQDAALSTTSQTTLLHATPRGDGARVRQPTRTKRQRFLRLIEGGLAALLVVASMLIAWLPRVQHLQPFNVGHHSPATGGGTILFTYQGGQGVVGSPVWPYASKYLALLSSFGYSVQVWDLTTENLIQNPLLPVPYAGPGTKSGWSWSPNGRYLAVTSEDASSRDGALQVWDTVTGHNTLTVHSHANGLLYTAWSFDGMHIACSGDDGTVQIWNPLTGQELLTFAGHPGNGGHRLFWSADDQLLLLSSSDGTFQLWNAFTGTNISTFHVASPALVELSPDGRRLVSMDHQLTLQVRDTFDQGTLQVWDTFTGRKLATYQGLPGGVSFLEWSPESRRILTANDSEVQIWDAITGHTILEFPNLASSSAWQSSPQSRRILTANDSEVQIWDAITGHTILEFPNLASSGAWQLSPDGRYFAFGSWNNGVQMWDAITGRKVSSYQGHAAPVQVLAWSSDGQLIAYASTDGTVQVRNVVTGSAVVTYHDLAHVMSLTWSPDDKLIAATTEDNAVHVLQIR